MLHNTGGSQALLPAWLLLGQHNPWPARWGCHGLNFTLGNPHSTHFPEGFLENPTLSLARVCPCRGGRNGQRKAQREAGEGRVRENQDAAAAQGEQGELETVTLHSGGNHWHGGVFGYFRSTFH